MFRRLTKSARPFQPALLLAVAFLLDSCAPASATFRYGVNFASAAASLPSPRVGTAVMIFSPSRRGSDVDSLREGLMLTLPSQLQAKGYDPTILHVLVLSGSFNTLSFDGTRPYRSQLQEPVFAAAQRQGLSGVFVLWVNASRSRPAEQAGYSLAVGTEEFLDLSARLEVCSPVGEPLCIHEAFERGMDSLKVTGVEGVVGSYRALSGAELADRLTRKALNILPFRSGDAPKINP